MRTYQKPSIEITAVVSSDVITASGVGLQAGKFNVTVISSGSSSSVKNTVPIDVSQLD